MKETDEKPLYLSVPKKQKLSRIIGYIGNTAGKTCLDIGSDNGVISWFLRKNGGEWSSVDLDEETVNSIRGFVGENVFLVDGLKLPFRDDYFDTAVIVDFLEHIEDDETFIRELHRVMKNSSTLVVNVPLIRGNSLLGRIKEYAGYTDEKHGHVRPGYTLSSLKHLLNGGFSVEEHAAYIGLFTELIDTITTILLFKIGRVKTGRKGMVVAGGRGKKQGFFSLYRLFHPLFETFSSLDKLVPFKSGANLILRAECIKP